MDKKMYIADFLFLKLSIDYSIGYFIGYPGFFTIVDANETVFNDISS
jgi:hypothetical protein